MKTKTLTMLIALLVFGAVGLNAQTGYGPGGVGFVDENGDGLNDLAPDHDLDGIPNGMDEDFVRGTTGGRNFVDEDGDGFNDNALDSDGDGIINCEDDDFVGGALKQMRGAAREIGVTPAYRNARTPRLNCTVDPDGK